MSEDFLGLLPLKLQEPDPDEYLGQSYCVLDFEVDGSSFGSATERDASIVLGCWLEGKQQRPHVYVEWGNEYSLRSLRQAVNAARVVVCHNAKYEVGWLLRIGMDLSEKLFYCTQIGEYVLAGNRKRNLSLDQTARRYGLGTKDPLVQSLFRNGSTALSIPRSLLQARCVKDVRTTHEIFLRQRELLRDAGLLRVAYQRNLVTPILAAMEFEGMVLDEERVRSRYKDLHTEYQKAKQEVDEVTGGINFRSSKQLGEFLYDSLGFGELRDRRGNPIRTEADKRKTDKTTLGLLEAVTPAQKEFKGKIKTLVDLKKDFQILETFKECLESEDKGLIRAVFNQTVCQNHRLSSTGGRWGLQFHNFPRAFKPLFKARKEGWVYVEADAPQLEFRVAVDLSGDARGRSDIRGGVDVHKLSQDSIGVSRQDAKKYTFRPLYGGNSGNKREQNYYKAFRERYSGVYSEQTGWVRAVCSDRSGALRTASGLIFYWPDTEVTRSGWITNTPSIFNYPVSSFATADVIPLALVIVFYLVACLGLRVQLVNTIHDSIVAECHIDDVEKYKEVLKFAFGEGVIILLKRLYGYEFKTPLGVGIKVSKNWGEGKEEKYEYDPIGEYSFGTGESGYVATMDA